jgi:hypothetical protein
VESHNDRVAAAAAAARAATTGIGGGAGVEEQGGAAADWMVGQRTIKLQLKAKAIYNP